MPVTNRSGMKTFTELCNQQIKYPVPVDAL